MKLVVIVTVQWRHMSAVASQTDYLSNLRIIQVGIEEIPDMIKLFRIDQLCYIIKFSVPLMLT